MTSAKSIFISYRRRNSSDITGRVYDRLVAHFSEDRVFKDVDSIPFGVNYRHHLEQEVSHCPVLLAIIDPNWLGVTDARGRLKLANPSDWVRVEIETALQRDRLVIPVLVGGATLPDEIVLPESLKGLAYRQSAQVRCDPDFHRDMDRLIHRIEGVFSGLALGGNAPARPPGSFATPSLIDELATALATASQSAQSSKPSAMGRRRWLRLMGLGLLGGGAAMAVRNQVPALQPLTAGDISRTMPDLTTWPDHLQQALERGGNVIPDRELEAPTLGGAYTYESVSVDEFGMERSQIKFSTPAYQELPIDTLAGPIALPMVSIGGGQFVMGAPATEPGHDPSQPPQTIALVEPFWMSIYPITQKQWRAVTMLPAVNSPLDPDPAHFKGDDLPVEQVSWPEAVEFCDRLNHWIETQSSDFPLRHYRLPTEAEWEYACRAKTTTPFNTGQTLTTELANYDGTHPYRQEPAGTFRGTTTAVGRFGKANDFGLYDMHGNVLEWCGLNQNTQDNTAWRVVRGGSWKSLPQHCRSAYRAGLRVDTHSPEVGFRLVAEE